MSFATNNKRNPVESFFGKCSENIWEITWKIINVKSYFIFFFFGGVDVSMEFTMEFILILSERFFLRTSSRGYSSSSVIRKGMDPLKFDIMRG